MLSAFAARRIVELKQKDKSKIESVLANGDDVFVGLSTGVLRVYTIDESSRHAAAPSPVSLRRELEKFSRKPVQQLAILSDADLLISLSDAYVSFHDLDNFALVEKLEPTKGATAFATIRNIVRDPDTGIPSIISRLAVVVRRKLLVWTWQDMELTSAAYEIFCPAAIKCVHWTTSSKVLIGTDQGFSVIDIDTLAFTDIVRPSEANEDTTTAGLVRFGAVNATGINYIGMSSWVPTPMATKLSDDQVLLARDVNTLFIDSSGNTLNKRQIPWVAGPDSIGYSYPYLLSLQEKIKGQLDIRNPDTLSLLQSIPLPNASILHVPQPNISLAHAGKGFLVASERCIWQMDAIGYGPQIDELSRKGYFDEALSLLALIEDTLMLDKNHRIREVKTQKALSLFYRNNFREALTLFYDAETPPGRVIALYPNTVTGNLSKVTTNDRDHEPLEGKRLVNATHELGAFLTQTRTEIRNYLAPDGRLLPPYRQWHDQSYQIQNGLDQDQDQDQHPPFAKFIDLTQDSGDIDWASELLEVAKLVDTTLFKVYMRVNPNMISFLFRTHNFCSEEVVEEKLNESGRYNELIDFLRGKGLHGEALKLLEQFGKQASHKEGLEEFRGPGKTINYLQQLPFEELDLILKYASWPLQVDPESAMEIFVADTENAENLPREPVLNFLQDSPILCIQYLEHIIYELHDTNPKFHDQLAKLYLTQLKNNDESAASKWPKSLEFLLKSSEQYNRKSVLKLLTLDDPRLFESRAIVLCKLSRHEEALKIYVYQIQDFKRAEDYCNQVYLSTQLSEDFNASYDPENAHNIYTLLLSLYLKPPSPHSPQLESALQLLSIHGPRLPALETLEALPFSLPINELGDYFKTRMRTVTAIAREEAVVASLRRVDKIACESDLCLGTDWDTPTPKISVSSGKNRRVILSENRLCSVCHKRFGGAAARLWPDGRLVHYGCSERLK